MRDYAELILDLRRHHCDAKEDDTQEVCEECAYDVIVADKSKFNGITDVCTCGLMHRAADAIEELLAGLERYRHAAFVISETCVEESKCHISPEEAIKKIRENIYYFRQMPLPAPPKEDAE